MKRSSLRFALLVVATICAFSCVKSGLDYELSSCSNTLYATVQELDTKVAFEDNAESGIALTWESGDTFSVYAADGSYVGDYSCTNVEDEAFSPSGESFEMVDGATYTAIYPAASTELTLEAARSRDLTSVQDGDAIANLDDACYMEASFTYLASADEKITLSFVHQMAIMSFTFISDKTPHHMIFENGDEGTYRVDYSEITPNTIEDDDYYTSHIMIKPCEATDNARTLTFSLFSSEDGDAYDIREATTSKAYLAAVRYNAPVSELEPTVWLGSGTAGDPYQISTSDQLRLLSTNANAGNTYSDTYFIMTNDIALGGSSNPFTPIGTNSYRFAGTFDGGGYEVSGLYFNDDQEQYLGLFGYVSEATIRNVGVSGTISGYNNIGGIVGYAIGVTIENCYNKVSLSSDSGNIGGIVGATSSSKVISIINCYNLGDITNNNTTTGVGGIIGYNAAAGTITNSYNGGVVESNGAQVGGIAGNSYNNGAITLCYNSGSVSGSSYVGSIMGITGSSSSIKTTLTNCYYLESSTDSYADKPISDDYMKGASFVAELNDLADDYNQLSTTTTKACAWVQTEGYPTLDPTTEPLPIYELEYDATSETYLINNGNGLKAFADLVNGNINTLDAKVSLKDGDAFESAAPSINGTLTDNIDLSAVCSSSASVGNWQPIGVSESSYYSGTFDGGSFTISNLYISSQDDYQALFGYTSGATISRLTVSGEVSGDEAVGGIVGSADNYTTISSCHNSAKVGGSDEVGGIVGLAAEYSTITESTNSGVVTGANYVGGIAGKSTIVITKCSNSSTNVTGTNTSTGGVVGENAGSISDCYNAGLVYGVDSCGGVVGENAGSISDCYNSSAVIGGSNSNSIGGVVGYNTGSITTSYNTSSISGTSNSFSVGGVAGKNVGDGSIINCYSSGAIDGYQYVGGVVGNNWEGATVTNCYNRGEVGGASPASNSYCGGVVGYNYDSTVTNCYNSAKVSADYAAFVGGVAGDNTGTITNCYYNIDVTASDKGGATGMVAAAMQYSTFVTTLNTGAYLYNQSLTDGAAKAYAWTAGDDYPQLDSTSYPTGGHFDMSYISGTSTYQINTALGLKAFADLVNGNTNTYGAFIENLGDSFGTMNSSIKGELTDNIDLSGVCGKTIGDWEPIGNVTITITDDDYKTMDGGFDGEFDGKYYTISNIYINSETKSYQGLFGWIYDTSAEVSNITITGEIKAYENVGGICGISSRGSTITSCHNQVNLTGLGDCLGGIAGNNVDANEYPVGSKINQCSNSGTVIGGGSYVGGITGDNYNGAISECYNTGDITSTSSQVGGIVGDSSISATGSSSVKNCYNTGDISGYSIIGGIVGSAQDTKLESCYSAAESITIAIDSNNVFVSYGGFVGSNVLGNSYTDCYYDSSVIFYAPEGNTIAATKTDLAKDKDEMTNVSFVTTLNGYSGTLWKEDTGVNNGYPILSWQ